MSDARRTLERTTAVRVFAAAALLAAYAGCASPRIGVQVVDQKGQGLGGVSVATTPPTDFKYSPPGGHVHISEMALQGGRTGPIPDGRYTLTASKLGCEQVEPVEFRVDGGDVDLGVVKLRCRQRDQLGPGGWEDPTKMPSDKPFLDIPYDNE